VEANFDFPLIRVSSTLLTKTPAFTSLEKITPSFLQYLARTYTEGVRWAIAGRSVPKLEEVREKLVAINPALSVSSNAIAVFASHFVLSALCFVNTRQRLGTLVRTIVQTSLCKNSPFLTRP